MSPPVAAQNCVVGHEIASSGNPAGFRAFVTFVTVQAARPPVGFWVLSTLPAESTAMHSPADGQLMPLTVLLVATGYVVTCHATEPCASSSGSETESLESQFHGNSFVRRPVVRFSTVNVTPELIKKT